MEPLLVNPPATELGRVNAILSGRSCRYDVREFPGPVSVKSVISGSAMWQTGHVRHVVEPGSALVLNDGQPYSLEIESHTPVETFCVFFRRGFVEDAARVARSRTETLLDDPARFVAQRFAGDGAVVHALGMCRMDPENGVFRLAEVLSGLHRLPAARLATRDELLRRVLRGRDYMEANLDSALKLADTAREAWLSPFHFHRAFRAVFGEAPHEYAARRRLELALDALRRSDESVTGIALRSGFRTPSAFATAFRRRFGATPREFRRILKVSERSGEPT